MQDTSASPRKRTYLPTEQRQEAILDAALIEFSKHGYAATTIDRIAARAGLSKPGFYAHYKSKEDVFNALLTKALLATSDADQAWLPDLTKPLPEIVDSYVDSLYVKIKDPRNIAIYRLILREGERAPETIRNWYAKVLRPSRAAQQAGIDQLVQKGAVRQGVLTENFFVAIAPAMLWVNMQLTLHEDCPVSFEAMRDIHKRMLLELLTPR